MYKIPSLHSVDLGFKRQQILKYFQDCFRRYESLFELISDEKGYFQKADNLRHPLIFYYGHTATFFINKFKLAKIIDKGIDSNMESMFAVGVDEMSWDDLDEGHYHWSSIEETKKYRNKVYTLVSQLIKDLPLTLDIGQDSPWWVILMGIEHENIHLETSSVLIRQLPLAFLKPLPSWKACQEYTFAPKNILLTVPEGKISIDTKNHTDFFAWDNEYGSHSAFIPEFKASKYLISHAEFLEFVQDKGYENQAYWTKEAWDWKTFSKASMPLFWSKNTKGYTLRLLAEEIPLPLSWAVEVNYHESQAFCAWKSAKEKINFSLATEDEYLRLYDFVQIDTQSKANINLSSFASSMPVNSHAHGDFYDVIGNVWQWTSTPMYPFEGFSIHPIYDDFTVPTFDGKHNIIKGGSWISCGNLASVQSRYAFRKHFYQHAGFRIVQSTYKENIVTNPYNTDTLISQYCHFGWNNNRLGVENYPEKCAKIALEIMKDKAKTKAFDIGCAIGRSSFELAREFDEVIGVDFSARFIQEAQKLKEEKTLRYTMPTEGELYSFHEVKLKDFNLHSYKDKVAFFQADACNLKAMYKDFDLIFAGNLIDRLYDPEKFLRSLASRLNAQGILILTSPYTWQEESTPKNKWIGGYKKDAENMSSLDGLIHILNTDFKLLESRDVPFVIQETARKHQHSIAQMSIWQKR